MSKSENLIGGLVCIPRVDACLSIFLEKNTLACIQSLEPKMVHTKGFYWWRLSLSLSYFYFSINEST